ncbi:MAG: FkbM family methyltransferase [Pyrinomonadaceae bacterium]|nr:FkbM family methyltransferase [Pyrinomonadaceae bacterium]
MSIVSKEWAKGLLRMAGFEVTRVARVRHTQEALFEHIRRLPFRPGTVIDVGVAYGTPELHSRFPGAKLLLIEPLEEFEPILKELGRKVGTDYVLAAAGAEPGTVTMNVRPQDLAASSRFEELGVPSERREVPMETLDTLIAERRLPGPYLIKVDVQGAELDVLNGAKQILKKTDFVLLEVSFFRFHSGEEPQFADVVRFMDERDFAVYDIVGGLNRPADDALAQVDVAFVKESGVFRQHHRYQL